MSDMILYDVNQAVQQVKNTKLIVSEMRRDVLVKDVDYGVVPGTTKPTLLKPGAERLCTAFGLCPEFEPISQIEDFEKGVFYYRYRCSLIHIATGKKIATGIGSCNSKEDKYRWRNEECPNCKKQKISKSKYPDRQTGVIGWYCGACKSNFPPDQFTGAREENTDPFSIINTLDKMAQKRALIAAVLIGTNASEFFTQDVEDLPRISDDDVIDADFVEPERKSEPPAPERKAQPKSAPASERTTEPPINSTVKRNTFEEFGAYLNSLVVTLKKGVETGTIAEGQQKNLAIAMQGVMENDTRKFLLQQVFGVESSKQLNERRFFALKEWLNGDPAQVEADVKLIIAAKQAALAGTSAQADAEFAAI